MFLALKEMKYAKLKYSLIIGVIFLIAYVVFMLSGLATGLAQEFKQVVDDWQADEIVLAKDANGKLLASQLDESDSNQIVANKKVPVTTFIGTISTNKWQENVTVFGTSEDAFILPSVIKGKLFASDNEVVISQNLADKGFKINDRVKIGQKDDLKIVGIVPATYYSATPVIYSSVKNSNEMNLGSAIVANMTEQPINALIVKGKSITENKDLKVLTVSEFIENIPGYTAQNMTLDAMIYFLFVVVTAVIGIFMYVITIQKTAIFGVMKAQGISNGFIAQSIVAQGFFVALIGVLLAFAAALATSRFLPSAMPFHIDVSQWFFYSMILISVTVIGSLFSIRSVTKVDPITVIGG